MCSVIGAVLIVIGLYMVLWGKSKEMKKVTDLEITPEIEEIEVVVASTKVDHHDSINCSNDSHACSKSHIVNKDHDNNSSKSEQEGQDTENNGQEELVSRE